MQWSKSDSGKGIYIMTTSFGDYAILFDLKEAMKDKYKPSFPAFAFSAKMPDSSVESLSELGSQTLEEAKIEVQNKFREIYQRSADFYKSIALQAKERADEFDGKISLSQLNAKGEKIPGLFRIKIAKNNKDFSCRCGNTDFFKYVMDDTDYYVCPVCGAIYCSEKKSV